MLLRSRPDEGKMGLFTALSDASFVQRPGGRRIFHPWGSRGRGYELRSEEEYRRLRREVAWLARIGIFGLPIVAGFTVPRSGILPVVLLAPLLTMLLVLRVAWLTRSLVPSEERISLGEARARLAEAVSAGGVQRITGFFVALAAVGLGLFLAGRGAEFLAVGIAMGLAAAYLRWSLWEWKRRFGRRSA